MRDLPLNSPEDVRARRHELVARINASTPEQQPLAFEALHSYFKGSGSDEQLAIFTDYESCLGEIGVSSILPISEDRLLLYFASLDSETDFDVILELFRPVMAATGAEVDLASLQRVMAEIVQAEVLEDDEDAMNEDTEDQSPTLGPSSSQLVASSSAIADPFDAVTTVDDLYAVCTEAIAFLATQPPIGPFGLVRD